MFPARASSSVCITIHARRVVGLGAAVRIKHSIFQTSACVDTLWIWRCHSPSCRCWRWCGIAHLPREEHRNQWRIRRCILLFQQPLAMAYTQLAIHRTSTPASPLSPATVWPTTRASATFGLLRFSSCADLAALRHRHNASEALALPADSVTQPPVVPIAPAARLLCGATTVAHSTRHCLADRASARVPSPLCRDLDVAGGDGRTTSTAHSARTMGPVAEHTVSAGGALASSWASQIHWPRPT
jgi:hypothetical protein